MFEIKEFTGLTKIIRSSALENIKGRIIIPFSGGVDSTLLAYHILQSLEDTEKEVYLVSINSYFVSPRQKEKERLSREHILDVFNKRDYNFNYVELDKEYNHENGETPLNGKHQSLGQPYIWLVNLAIHLNDDDSIFFSYINDDCFWKDDYKEKFDELLLSYEYIFDLIGVTIHFPLKDFSKKKGIDLLYPTGLLDDIWYCESNDDIEDTCGECNSCRVHNNALMELLTEDEDNNWAYDFLSNNYKKLLRGDE